MTNHNGRAFNEWLRAQLKAKKMSQRQLAQQSGVDHSTISRLIRGDRMPSLGTATKLARGLRELRDDADTPQYLGLVSAGAANPTARVEYALRADELLTEPQVRQIMEYYLAVRMRRFGRPLGQPDGSNERGDRPGRARSLGHGAARAGSGSVVGFGRPGGARDLGGIRPMAAPMGPVAPDVRAVAAPPMGPRPISNGRSLRTSPGFGRSSARRPAGDKPLP